MTPNILNSFKQYLESIHHPLVGDLEFDSANWQRYDCPTSSKGNKNVSYKAHSDMRPCIKVKCHKCYPDQTLVFKYEENIHFSRSQYESMQQKAKKHKAEQAKVRATSIIAMRSNWDKAKPCLTHKYFDRKGLAINELDGLRIDNRGQILCPIWSINNELISTQSIPLIGKKIFYSGVSPKNGFHIFGSIETSDEIYFAEGIATCLTIKFCLNKPVICVYGKHFSDIAPLIAKKYPSKKLFYCCDLPSEKETSTSESNARKAITLVGGLFSLPNFSEISPDLRPEIKRSDFNDLFVLLLAKHDSSEAAVQIIRQQIQLHSTRGNCMSEDKADQSKSKQSNEKEPKASEALLRLIDESDFEFFHDSQQETFCKFKSIKTGIYEVRRLDEKSLKIYLSYIFRREFKKTIADNSLKEALIELGGRALHDGKQEKVFLRVGELKGKIYIDLCDDYWRAVEISAEGWRILKSNDTPIRFERNQHMKPLPEPDNPGEGNISLLWEMINIPKEDQCLILTFILDCFRCNTQFTILTLLGHQGSGKSTTQDILRDLIDPSICNLRTAPRKLDDLVTEAIRNYLLSYNNVSGLTNEMHDDFCCISTGGGFSTRKLFKDNEQVVSNISRPSMINGITNFIRRPDFLDRAVIIELPQMENRISDEQLKLKAKKSLPSIFGGLLDLMVKVLKIFPTVSLPAKPPRMVDYAILGIAIEQAMNLPKNTFINQYQKNRNDAQESVIESSPIILALIDYIEQQPDQFWRGRPSDLLEVLTERKKPTAKTNWPESVRAMGDALKRYEIPLKQFGIEVIAESKDGGKRNRKGAFYRISKIPPQHAQHTQNEEKTNSNAASDTTEGVHNSNTSDEDVHTAKPNVHQQDTPEKPHDTYVSNAVGACGTHSAHDFPFQNNEDGTDESILI